MFANYPRHHRIPSPSELAYMRQLEQQARYEAYEREQQADALRRRRQAAELFEFRQQQLQQERLEEEQARCQHYVRLQQRRRAAAETDNIACRRARSVAPSCSSDHTHAGQPPIYARVPVVQATSPPANRMRVQQRIAPSREQIIRAVLLVQRSWRHKQAINKRLAALQAIAVELTSHTSIFSFPAEPVFDASGKLIYTHNNMRVHAYIESLERLLLRLDGIESEGTVIVKDRRRTVVKAVEKELERVESWKAEEWERLRAHSEVTAIDELRKDMEVDPKPIAADTEIAVNIPISSPPTAPAATHSIKSAHCSPIDDAPTATEATDLSSDGAVPSVDISIEPLSNPAAAIDKDSAVSTLDARTEQHSNTSTSATKTAHLDEAADGVATTHELALDAGHVLVDLSDEEESAEDFVVVNA